MRLALIFSLLLFTCHSQAEVFKGQLISSSNYRVPLEGCVREGSANLSISALFIGNSLTHVIPENTIALLKCSGVTVDIAASSPGGYTLDAHTYLQESLDLISEGYDYVILQEHSTGMIDQNAVTTLETLINNAGSQMVFYQTWGYWGDEQSRLAVIASYENFGSLYSTPVVAVGQAWQNFYTRNPAPSFDLFSDYVHANNYGTYLNALVFYAWFTGESPIGLRTIPVSMDADTALLLQTIAWETHQAYH